HTPPPYLLPTFFSSLPRPPTSTLFPYTTLFRSDVLHRRRHRRHLLERRAGRGGNNPRERRLAAAGRPVEDRGVDAVLLDRAPQGRALAQDMLLPDELGEGRGPQALRERRDLARVLVGGVGEEIPHVGSMLSCVRRLDGAR